jgi:hypothetical protein
MHAELILSVFRPERFEYVFMTVRDPMSRVLSEYKMRRGSGGEERGLADWFDFTTKRYLADRHYLDNHIRPQIDFLLPGCEVFRQEGGLGQNFVARLEEKLKLSLPIGSLGAENEAKPIEIDPSEIRQIEPAVRQFYWEDYLRFGY